MTTPTKTPAVSQRVQCMDTKEFGTVVALKGGQPVVKFDNGAVGPCTACRKVT